MTDLSAGNLLSPIERARLSAELLQVRERLSAAKLSPIEQVRVSARGLELRALLGAPAAVGVPVRPAAPESQQVLATGIVTQKNGSVLVTGDPASLSAYVTARLSGAKHTQTADGIVFAKGQSRLAEFIPDSGDTLASGAVVYHHAALGGGASVAFGGEQSGVAHSLASLKSLTATEWGPEKYRAVFGEDAAPDDVAAYEQQQAEIAQRKQAHADGIAATEAEKLLAPQRAQEQAAVAAQELAGVLAEREAESREWFERTIGAGRTDNPIYQAYLDTLEQLPTFNESNAGFLGWATLRAGEFERQGNGRPSVLKDQYQAYVRQWADSHLSERVAAARGPQAISKETSAGDDPADEYAAQAVGFDSFSLYALSRTDKLPLESFQVARAKYKIVEYLEQNGRGDRITLSSLSLQGANSTGPSALAQLRQDGYVLNNLRAKSKPFSLAHGVTLATFVSGSAKPVPVAEQLRSPAALDQEPAPADSPHQIIEYTTKRDKVLRGIIRTDVTLAEAKAIDPYTWKLNGGYFIREKHLGADTAHIQAATAPVVLSAEQQADQQATAERQAEQRRQQALAGQVQKLRAVADKAVATGDSGLNADRNTNTARRAGMAAGAIAKAAADKAAGQTLNNIADAIESGAGGALAKLTSRAQLEGLLKLMRAAQYEADRHLTYSEQLARKGRPFSDDDIRNLAFPRPTAWSNRYKAAALTMAKKAAQGNSRLIAALTKIGGGAERIYLDDEKAAITRKANTVLKAVGESWDLSEPIEALAVADRLARLGVTDVVTLQDAVRELLPHLAERVEEDPIKKAERAIIGAKVGIDFFPTPAHVAQRMARLAGITEGMRVLEPSAGNGNLADAAKAAGAVVDVVEISSQLRDILTAKGYNVVSTDFDGFTPGEPYQAILMNPPFSKRQDAAHIMKAFTMLAGGGHLVAIAGEGVFFGQDQKAQAFREWLDDHGATVEALEGGTFKDNTLLAQTSANARLIVLKK